MAWLYAEIRSDHWPHWKRRKMLGAAQNACKKETLV